MDIVEATGSYERWMRAELARRGLKPVTKSLEDKHRRMAKEGAFAFLRATYYRWAQLWPLHCAELAKAPHVRSVGDLHLENFGTWRDGEGRLCWGINDFDETYRLSYANDLVRLATSALFAAENVKLEAKPRAIADAIGEGYAHLIMNGPKPFVLEERNGELRAMAYAEKDPGKFWSKNKKETSPQRTPENVRRLLERQLPEGVREIEFLHREKAGLGSLGRPRYLARAKWHDSFVAREAKALIPSAGAWLAGAKSAESEFASTLGSAARSRDPCLTVSEDGVWVVRRLAPRSSKIEIDDLPNKTDAVALLRAMGEETANVHCGSPAAIKPIRRDLDRREPGWLLRAATAMAEIMRGECKTWRESKAWKR